MKKLSLLLMFVSILFVSCSKDEETKAPNSANTTAASGEILGEWNAETVYYTGENKITQGGMTFDVTFVGQGKNYDCKVNFKDNPKEVTSEGAYDIDLTVNINGAGQTTTQESVSFDTVGDWRQEGDFIYVKNHETKIEDKMEIKELTDKRMVLEGYAERDVQGNGHITKLNAKYVLVR